MSKSLDTGKIIDTREIIEQLAKIRAAAMRLRTVSSAEKNKVLLNLCEKLKKNEAEILSANQKDLESYQKNSSYQKAYADRLLLNINRLQQMVESIEAVIEAQDPVGTSVEQKTLENGLIVNRVRGPLGVCFMIFESRPNVITEAFSLAIKSSNALILKGGKESDHTARVLYQLLKQSLAETLNLPDVFWGLAEVGRDVTDFLMKQSRFIDVLIPRGGERLIEYVTENSRIPLIKNDRGMCHMYVHDKAHLEMALNIVDNAKTQRPGVCNAIETLLVDEAIASDFLPQVFSRLKNKNVEFFVCEKAQKILNGPNVFPATKQSFDTEYLDFKINIKVIENLYQAINHIERHGSRHSEAIITEDVQAAQEFQQKIDAAAIYWNASTRFTDGYQLGLGGEMGVSTQKLHVRGPVGLEALTVPRWVISGKGQIRN
jgi:glutamate-5-semialdehyde dehydrogenase